MPGRAEATGRSGPAAEVRVAERVRAVRAADPLRDAVEELERPVALGASAVAAVDARVGEIDDAQLLARLAEREAAPEAGAPRLPPADRELAGGIGAYGALVFDEGSHVRSRYATRAASKPSPRATKAVNLRDAESARQRRPRPPPPPPPPPGLPKPPRLMNAGSAADAMFFGSGRGGGRKSIRSRRALMRTRSAS